MQLASWREYEQVRQVSILTGLERPVQHGWTVHERRGPGGFQSSPALKDRCNLFSGKIGGLTAKFQSSPALKDRCNRLRKVHKETPIPVSILTGLERPVQLASQGYVEPAAEVSILTGLERPVQPGIEGLRRAGGRGFNPHGP